MNSQSSICTTSTTINGNAMALVHDARERALDVIREQTGTTGTKLGCGAGACRGLHVTGYSAPFAHPVLFAKPSRITSNGSNSTGQESGRPESQLRSRCQGAYVVAVPVFLFGLVLVGTGLGVGLRTDAQVKPLRANYKEAPVSMVHNALSRMQKVMEKFRLTYYSFGIIAVVAIFLHDLGGPTWGRGPGAALLFIASVGLLVDGFVERWVIGTNER